MVHVYKLSNIYTMAFRGNPRASASGLSFVQVDKHGITIYSTSVNNLQTTSYFVLKLVRVVLMNLDLVHYTIVRA